MTNNDYDDWLKRREWEINDQWVNIIQPETYNIVKNINNKDVTFTFKGADLKHASTFIHSWRTYKQQGANFSTELTDGRT